LGQQLETKFQKFGLQTANLVTLFITWSLSDFLLFYCVRKRTCVQVLYVSLNNSNSLGSICLKISAQLRLGT